MPVIQHLVLATVLVTISCGGGGGGADIANGRWSVCSGGTKSELNFSSGRLVKSRSNYSTAECTGDMRDEIETSMETGFGEEIVDSLFELDVVYSNTIYTLYNADLVTSANELFLGGYQDWEVGVGKDVTGIGLITMSASPKKGEMSLGLVSVEDGMFLRIALGQVGTPRPSGLSGGDLLYVKN